MAQYNPSNALNVQLLRWLQHSTPCTTIHQAAKQTDEILYWYWFPIHHCLIVASKSSWRAQSEFNLIKFAATKPPGSSKGIWGPFPYQAARSIPSVQSLSKWNPYGGIPYCANPKPFVSVKHGHLQECAGTGRLLTILINTQTLARAEHVLVKIVLLYWFRTCQARQGLPIDGDLSTNWSMQGAPWCHSGEAIIW